MSLIVYFEHLYCWPRCCCHGDLAVDGYPAGILMFMHSLASMLFPLSMLALAPMLLQVILLSVVGRTATSVHALALIHAIAGTHAFS
jgi:hypothetical protein